ncbi:hypothetical protein BDP27DRAFT_1451001 [Rhodocollybia butyracea]|uniref:Uncharacterized protein n=1 Tax=Rhodocollybia butyracea TaxID=206335 RepID=A0A9P5U2Y5_9AGAR|nr:hypothetical protein BDP27DRAFT_1451001 [Rhodocollybia butyracea]
MDCQDHRRWREQNMHVPLTPAKNPEERANKRPLTSTKRLSGTVTFIDQKGVKMRGPEVSKDRKANLSPIFGRAVRAAGRFPGEIFYEGSYQPLLEGRKWVLFTLVGLFEECTELDPCIGWMARGYRFQQKEDRLEASKMMQFKSVYLGIFKGGNDWKEFVYLAKLPAEGTWKPGIMSTNLWTP